MKSVIFNFLAITLPIVLILTAAFGVGFFFRPWYGIDSLCNNSLSALSKQLEEINDQQENAGPLSSPETSEIINVPHLIITTIPTQFQALGYMNPFELDFDFKGQFLSTVLPRGRTAAGEYNYFYSNMYVQDTDKSAKHYTIRIAIPNDGPSGFTFRLDKFMDGSNDLSQPGNYIQFKQGQKIYLLRNFKDRNDQGEMSNPLFSSHGNSQQPLFSMIAEKGKFFTRIGLQNNIFVNLPVNDNFLLRCIDDIDAVCKYDQDWHE